MKRMKIIFYLLLYFTTVINLNAFDNARSAAMGGNLIALSEGAEANWGNPALLSFKDENNIIITYQNPYNTANLISAKIGYKQTVNEIAFGIFMDILKAANVYSDTKIGVNLSKRFNNIFRKTSLLLGSGIIIRDNSIDIVEKSNYRYGLPVGGFDILYRINYKTQISVGANFKYDYREKKSYSKSSLSILMRKIGNFNIGIDIDDKKYSAGFESKELFNLFKLRMGITANKPDKDVSLTESGGIGFSFENFVLDFSYVYNQVLSGYELISIRFIL